MVDLVAMRRTAWSALALACLSSPATAAAEDESRPWALVGISVDQKALVVTSPQAPERGGVVRLANYGVSATLGFWAPVDTGPAETTVISDLMPHPLPSYVVRLPSKLSGRPILGEERLSITFDAHSWNTWRGASDHEAYRIPPRFKAPSTVGLNVADAREIVAGLGLPATAVTVRGPLDGIVVRQHPSRTGWISPRTTRVTFTTRSR